MKQTNIELALEVIGQSIFESIPETSESKEEEKEITQICGKFLNEASNGYKLVSEEDIKIYKNEIWFNEESFFILDKNKGNICFVPIKRII